eukprot:2176555-Prorocentrum_lima.AAC.1
MTSSLVGSEMCIRDRSRWDLSWRDISPGNGRNSACNRACRRSGIPSFIACLLYTSDAADDM